MFEGLRLSFIKALVFLSNLENDQKSSRLAYLLHTF